MDFNLKISDVKNSVYKKYLSEADKTAGIRNGIVDSIDEMKAAIMEFSKKYSVDECMAFMDFLESKTGASLENLRKGIVTRVDNSLIYGFQKDAIKHPSPRAYQKLSDKCIAVAKKLSPTSQFRFINMMVELLKDKSNEVMGNAFLIQMNLVVSNDVPDTLKTKMTERYLNVIKDPNEKENIKYVAAIMLRDLSVTTISDDVKRSMVDPLIQFSEICVEAGTLEVVNKTLNYLSKSGYFDI